MWECNLNGGFFSFLLVHWSALRFGAEQYLVILCYRDISSYCIMMVIRDYVVDAKKYPLSMPTWKTKQGYLLNCHNKSGEN